MEVIFPLSLSEIQKRGLFGTTFTNPDIMEVCLAYIHSQIDLTSFWLFVELSIALACFHHSLQKNI